MNQALVTIEFDPQGNIKTASSLFLKVMGYQMDELVGKHHRIFCGKSYVQGVVAKIEDLSEVPI